MLSTPQEGSVLLHGVPRLRRWGGEKRRKSRTAMFGSCLIGVYSAPNGTTHFVASSLLFGQTFHDSRIASCSSNTWKVSVILAALVKSPEELTFKSGTCAAAR